MEDGVLQDPRVKEAEKKHVILWLHYDHATEGEANIALQRKLLGFQANPYWVLVDPETLTVIRKQDFTEDVATMLRFFLGE